MAFLKSILGAIVAFISFIIASAAMQTKNDIVMVIFGLLMIFAALYAIYEWDKKD
jgi:uncharacterized membrane protein YfcA